MPESGSERLHTIKVKMWGQHNHLSETAQEKGCFGPTALGEERHYPHGYAIWLRTWVRSQSSRLSKGLITYRTFMQGRNGGAKRDRTADLVNAIHALSQLSYSPTSKRHNRFVVKRNILKRLCEINPHFHENVDSFPSLMKKLSGRKRIARVSAEEGSLPVSNRAENTVGKHLPGDEVAGS